MVSIKFSHEYPKLWGQKKAELIAVRILNAQAVQINKSLIEYDTKYEKFYPDRTESGYYELPKEGHLIQLIFMGDKDIPFCTLRSWTSVKEKWYRKQIGTILDIEHTS